MTNEEQKQIVREAIAKTLVCNMSDKEIIERVWSNYSFEAKESFFQKADRILSLSQIGVISEIQPTQEYFEDLDLSFENVQMDDFYQRGYRKLII